MAKAKKRVAKSKAKKKWYPILAPSMFNSQVIGEIPVEEPSKVIGRIVPVNLMNLTGDMRKQSTTISFKINSITGEKAYTEVIGFDVAASAIKRIIRRGKRKVDTNVSAKTSDEKKIKLKIVLVTRGLTCRSVLSSLRKSTKENLIRIIGKMKYDEVLKMLTINKLQIDLKKSLNKIYPIKMCEVRHMSIEKEKKHHEEEPKAEIKQEEKVEEKETKPEKKAKEAEKPEEKKTPSKEIEKPKETVKEEKKEEAVSEKKEVKTEEKPEEKKEAAPKEKKEEEPEAEEKKEEEKPAEKEEPKKTEEKNK